MKQVDFSTVTEIPGGGATSEQIDMLRTRYDLAARLADGADVLEVACGTGAGLGYIARRAGTVVAGDADDGLLRLARAHYGDRFDLRHLDAHELPYASRTFDLVMLLEAIYYLHDPARFIEEARRVLRPGGTVYLCSANREWTLFNPSPYARRYFSAAELGEVLETAGFTAEVSAGFPDSEPGLRRQALRRMRKAAVSLHLVPKTMNGKEKLKRLLYGRLDPLPLELTESIGRVHPLTPILDDSPVRRHKVLYAVGRLPRKRT